MKEKITLLIIVTLFTGIAVAENPLLSIRDIQYTTDPTGYSDWQYEVVDCVGGIVTSKYRGGWPRFCIQDPNEPNAWSAIQVKDGTPGSAYFDSVELGDYVSIVNGEVEEFSGVTFLLLLNQNSPQINVISSGNPLPAFTQIDTNEIPAPICTEPGNSNCYVADHSAEKYESMLIELNGVVVIDIDYGKEGDNYVLQSIADVNDPCCWAADYMNVDAFTKYHPLVAIDQEFCRIRGVLEHYLNTLNDWDYYQLITRETEDFGLPIDGDYDYSCDVDFLDYATLSDSESVDLNELSILCTNWLESR